MDIGRAVNAYTSNYGLQSTPITDRPVQVQRARDIADLYARSANVPWLPVIQRSYNALIHQITAQWFVLQSCGLRFDRWSGTGEPYASSADMLQDLASGHLYFLPTATAGELADNHPMARAANITLDGTSLLANDVFRAVHDAIGHGVYGWSFGARGEDNAYRTHKQTLTPNAWIALANETRAQNSYVNFGQHLRRHDGSLPVKGDVDYVPLSARKFAPQRTVLLPSVYLED